VAKKKFADGTLVNDVTEALVNTSLHGDTTLLTRVVDAYGHRHPKKVLQLIKTLRVLAPDLFYQDERGYRISSRVTVDNLRYEQLIVQFKDHGFDGFYRRHRSEIERLELNYEPTFKRKQYYDHWFRRVISSPRLEVKELYAAFDHAQIHGDTRFLQRLIDEHKEAVGGKAAKRLEACFLVIWPGLRTRNRNQLSFLGVRRGDRPQIDIGLIKELYLDGPANFFEQHRPEFSTKQIGFFEKLESSKNKSEVGTPQVLKPDTRAGPVRTVSLAEYEYLGRDAEADNPETFFSDLVFFDDTESIPSSHPEKSGSIAELKAPDIISLLEDSNYEAIKELWNARHAYKLTRTQGALLLRELRYIDGIDKVRMDINSALTFDGLEDLDDDTASSYQENLIPASEQSNTTRVRIPVRAEAKISRFERDAAVTKWVLAQAQGQCESCLDEAPFQKDDGTPFLEVHHLKRLADGGSDTKENAIAVCPNCHRALHFASERESMRSDILHRVARLIDER
jgi:5-methylcytosine-specific restriction endonuclease McrA